MINQGMMSSLTDDWATPKDLFRKLNEVFKFTLDPCASEANAKCENFLTKEDDSLNKDWSYIAGYGNIFMNPPYGRGIGVWVKKASEQRSMVVCLLPARTDTKWWQDYCLKADVIHFIEGRLYFERGGGDAEGRSPFP